MRLLMLLKRPVLMRRRQKLRRISGSQRIPSPISSKTKTLRARFNSGCSSPISQRLRTSKAEKVDRLLFNWFTSAHAANISITGEILREKAQKIANELEMTDWNCSNTQMENAIQYQFQSKLQRRIGGRLGCREGVPV